MYEYGGLKLINLEAFNAALKAAWVPRMYLNKSWFCRKMLNHCIHFNYDIFPFLQLTEAHFHNVVSKHSYLSTFFEEVMLAWLKAQKKPPDNMSEYLRQFLWFNSNILIDRLPFFWEAFSQRGILFVNDLLNTDGYFMTYRSFIGKYGRICDEFKFIQLLSSIPFKWKQSIQGIPLCETAIMPVTKYSKWVKGLKINKELYRFYLVERKCVDFHCKAQEYWMELFNDQIQWDVVL